MNVSELNGPDQLAGQEKVHLDTQLRQILGPGRVRRNDLPSNEGDPGAAAKVMSDIDHLLAHYKSGATWFVTTGVRTILKWKGQLAWKAGRKKAEVARSLGVDRSTVAKYTAKASVR